MTVTDPFEAAKIARKQSIKKRMHGQRDEISETREAVGGFEDFLIF
jgi:hypothetical protein